MATEITRPVGVHEPSLPEVYSTVRISRSPFYWKRLAGFLGPGFLIAVGYMDPGNWATDIAGGSRYGYTLLSVIMISNLMAILLQSLSLKLGVATERDLAQLSRESTGRIGSFILWLMAEVAIAACDMAEVIGSAIALQLLFHIPLIYGVLITGLDVLLILLLQRWGFRYVEALVIALIGTILVLFAIQMVLSKPDYLPALHSLFIPPKSIVTDPGMLFIAIGMLGATVMPHNLYLHSAIAQTRDFERNDAGKREAIRFATIDSSTALIAALFINAAILMLAASFHRAGLTDIAEMGDAYRMLAPVLGSGVASLLFGVALLASGQISAVTGTLAGQVVMEGFMRWRLSPVARRLLTRGLAILPAVAVTAISGESATGQLLVLSQVVLSLQLSFAVVPLVMFTSDKSLMGAFTSPGMVRCTGWFAAALIVVLNGWLVWQSLW
jgi:manganese transport protein